MKKNALVVVLVSSFVFVTMAHAQLSVASPSKQVQSSFWDKLSDEDKTALTVAMVNGDAEYLVSLLKKLECSDTPVWKKTVSNRVQDEKYERQFCTVHVQGDGDIIIRAEANKTHYTTIHTVTVLRDGLHQGWKTKAGDGLFMSFGINDKPTLEMFYPRNYVGAQCASAFAGLDNEEAKRKLRKYYTFNDSASK